jgi:uncharacterized phiE125 gp8 family phage protein
MQPWQPTALLPLCTLAPDVRLLTTDEAKTHLRVDGSTEDDYIDSLVLAAEQHLDGFSGVLGRALITQTWQRSFDGFPCGDTIRLPIGPLQSVAMIQYYDLDGSHIAFGSSNYHAISDAIGPCIRLADTAQWPNTSIRPDAVTVTWICGYGDAATDVPAPIVHAIKLLVGHYHLNREATAAGGALSPMPLAVDALIEPYRGPGLA